MIEIYFPRPDKPVPMRHVNPNDIVVYPDGAAYRLVAYGTGLRFHAIGHDELNAALYEREKAEHEDARWDALDDYDSTVYDFQAGTGRI